DPLVPAPADRVEVGRQAAVRRRAEDLTRRDEGSALQDHRGAVAEQALVRGEPDLRAVDLAVSRLAAELPRHLAHLSDRLRGHRLAEAAQATARVDRCAAPDRRVTVVEQPLGLALGAQTDVLVPVEL